MNFIIQIIHNYNDKHHLILTLFKTYSDISLVIVNDGKKEFVKWIRKSTKY